METLSSITNALSYSARYGPGSVEHGHELLKFSDVLSAQLEEECRRELDKDPLRTAGSLPAARLAPLAAEARAALREAAGVFRAHFGEGDRRCREAEEKMGQLAL